MIFLSRLLHYYISTRYLSYQEYQKLEFSLSVKSSKPVLAAASSTTTARLSPDLLLPSRKNRRVMANTNWDNRFEQSGEVLRFRCSVVLTNKGDTPLPAH